MKFNFFVLIGCLLIHFIAQAGSAQKQTSQTAPAVKTERSVAAAAPQCDCDSKE